MSGPPGWHPILHAVEDPVGVWTMRSGVDGEVTSTVYAIVRLVRRGPEVGYRVDLDGRPAGYYRTLRGAAEAAWTGSMELRAWRREQAAFPLEQREEWPGFQAGS